MTIFNHYAAYYDLLYQDKDYLAEAQYVHNLIQTHSPGAKSILDLGCGTGGHAFPLAQMGYAVTGVDLSPRSIQIAKEKQQGSTGYSEALDFHVGDIRTIRLERNFDVVVSLFHVMSYQTHQDILATLTTAKNHLKPCGLFLFDFWYGPGVLSDPPKVAIKRLDNEIVKVIRIAEPKMYHLFNSVDVNYTLIVLNKLSNECVVVEEKHKMRYFFKNELQNYLLMKEINMKEFYVWMTMDSPVLSSWNVLSVCVL
jgi:SAM-dependent methyltransferase